MEIIYRHIDCQKVAIHCPNAIFNDTIMTKARFAQSSARQRWKLNLNGLVDDIDGHSHTAVEYCNGNAANKTNVGI
jgi:hypothetical protein